MSVVFLLLTVSWAALDTVSAGIKVILPEYFNNNSGILEHNMALFGRPNYGGNLIGNLLLAPKENRFGCMPFNHSDFFSADDPSEKGDNFILAIARGECQFVIKVRNAQAVSAIGAVIYDTDDTSTTLPIMSDDDSSQDVNIPSLIIFHSDAKKLFPAELNPATNATTTVVVATPPPVVIIDWKVPHPDNRVEYELWTSSSDGSLTPFITTFRTVFHALGEAAQFTPHYEAYRPSVMGCNTTLSNYNTSSSSTRCDQLCVDGQVCIYDPEHDLTVGMNGIDVLQEDMRQLCLWEVVNASSVDLHMAREAWWDYIAAFEVTCRHPHSHSQEEGEKDHPSSVAGGFNVTCSEHLIQNLLKPLVDVTFEMFSTCVSTRGLDLLLSQVTRMNQYAIISTPRLLVNELQHYGEVECELPITLSTCSPLRMICAGFSSHATTPSCCTTAFWQNRAIKTMAEATVAQLNMTALTPGATLPVSPPVMMRTTTTCDSPRVYDDCHVCLDPVVDKTDWNIACKGCDGVLHSGKRNDVCGMCDGNGSFDLCGSCLDATSPGRDRSCLDCHNTLFGSAIVDPCGICGGHGSFDACGNCYDQYDPRRQNLQCVLLPSAMHSGRPSDSDMNSHDQEVSHQVLVTLRLTNLTAAFFSASPDVAPALKETLMRWCITPHTLDTLVTSTASSQRATEVVLVTHVTPTVDHTSCDVTLVLLVASPQVASCLKALSDPASGLQLAMDMKKFHPHATAAMHGITTLSATENLSLAPLNIKEEKTSTPNNSYVGVLFLLVCGAAGGLARIMYTREKKLRGDVHRMFQQYSPIETDDDHEHRLAYEPPM